MGIISSYVRWLGKKAETGIERTVRDFIPKGSHLSYLDCGCDDGAKTIGRANVIGTKNISGIEIITSRAELAIKRGIRIYDFDLNDVWNIPNNSFDVVTATEVVEHLIDLDNFFDQIKRVLKKGGKLIISTENLASPHNIFALILGSQPFTGPYLSCKFSVGYQPVNCYRNSKKRVLMPPHLNVMTKKALIRLLELNGFKILGIKGIGFYPFPPFLAGVLSLLAKNYATYVIVEAIKE